MSIIEKVRGLFGKPDPFPLRTEDKTVAALLEAGHDELADRLSYEINAAEGNSVTNHFNDAAGVDRAARNDLDFMRRAKAERRVTTLKAEAVERLGFDPEAVGNDDKPDMALHA